MLFCDVNQCNVIKYLHQLAIIKAFDDYTTIFFKHVCYLS